MKLATTFTTVLGACAHLLSAAPTQPPNINHTTIPPYRQERSACTVIGPGPYFLIVLWSVGMAELERENIESSCGFPTEAWEVQSFHVPPGGEDLRCVRAMATFKMANSSRGDPIGCVGTGLTRPFTRVICVR
ncbi:hypothetical protein PspLS_09306 [Pyricularia sp. CBS 133598]|nr:hypothetical protein PspLS_09306 [Pyricularia sp. CBS 133598]